MTRYPDFVFNVHQFESGARYQGVAYKLICAADHAKGRSTVYRVNVFLKQEQSQWLGKIS